MTCALYPGEILHDLDQVLRHAMPPRPGCDHHVAQRAELAGLPLVEVGEAGRRPSSNATCCRAVRPWRPAGRWSAANWPWGSSRRSSSASWGKPTSSPRSSARAGRCCRAGWFTRSPASGGRSVRRVLGDDFLHRLADRRFALGGRWRAAAHDLPLPRQTSLPSLPSNMST